MTSSQPEIGAESEAAPSPTPLPVKLEVEHDQCLNFAMQQNGIALIKRLTIENLGDRELRGIVVNLRTDPVFAEPLLLRLTSLAPGARHVWENPLLSLSLGFLAGLRERLHGNLHITVQADGHSSLSDQRRVDVLAYDEWAGLRSLPELLAAFVLPNHPTVAHWLQESARLLQVWTADPSLSGYQSKNRDRVVKTAAAVFGAMQASGITYVVPPASFEQSGQKVRTPDRLGEEKLGTCLDLALTAAACLEQAGLHALLVLVDGHAFAGVWLDESVFPDGSTEDLALLAKRVELGELVVFDPTLLTARPVGTFEDSIQAARKRLREPRAFRTVIDITRSRRGGIRPLPLRAEGVALDDLNGPPAPADPSAPEIVLPKPAPAPGTQQSPASRIDGWKRRLLDLTNRNRLLNFKETKKTVSIECRKLGSLEDLLADGVHLELREYLQEMRQSGPASHPIADETMSQLLDHELKQGRLVTRHERDDLEARSTEIFRAAREGLEEGGASGLYLALGFLEWFESATSDIPRRAPLILVPVDLIRGSIRQGFRLARAADETRFNTTLIEMLTAQFKVNIAGVDPLSEDASGVDVDGAFQSVRAAVKHVPRWRVLEEARIGFFTFAKFLMWQDLHKQSDVLLQNRLVSHLVRQPGQPFDRDWNDQDQEALDGTYQSAELYCPVSADSSQLAAVLAAGQGKSFVLEGPPGTGKSQTITNLIAHCLATGKTVLFVSEKTAALNVVFDRLKKIGLERFCLELHSNKASKHEVISRLGEALHGTKENAPAQWLSLAAQLDQMRAELNTYARLISQRHSNGLSVFRATSILTSVRGAPSIQLGWPDIGSCDESRVESCRTIVRDTQNALLAMGSPNGHALDGIGIKDVPAGLRERIQQQFGALQSELATIGESADAIVTALGFDLARASTKDLHTLDSLCAAILGGPALGFDLIACDPEQVKTVAAEVCADGRKRDALLGEIANRFERRLLELDLLDLRAKIREATASWSVARWWKARPIRKSLLAVSKPRPSLTLAQMSAGVECGLELRDVDARLNKAIAAFERLSGAKWNVEQSPWGVIDSAVAWSKTARSSILTTATNAERAKRYIEAMVKWVASQSDRSQLRSQCEPYHSALARTEVAASQVASQLCLSDSDSWRTEQSQGRITSWRERIDRIEPGLGALKSWALWRRLRAEMIDNKLLPLVQALESGGVHGEALTATFERSFHENWLDWARAQEPVLFNFLSESQNQRIERFRLLDAQCAKLAQRVVASKLSAQVPQASSSSIAGSELGLLQRELQKKTRHVGPRKLFQETKSIIQKLKPCFLMSPISVAQYLEPGKIKFDIVVFDEASQIPTWDAVGAIARGDQTVVVGDSKQLPPTSFFEVVLDDGNAIDGEVEELESILDECRAANVPALDLRWHYRSRHETLITFSNRKYYDNRLHTFPSAKFEGLGVQWRHVPGGVYDRGRSRTNHGEAVALVAEVVRRLRDPVLSRHSIGVVTFSAAQQKKVEDLLDEERRADPSLDSFFVSSDERREAVFIKNLENVQGDERDVILFSICYGPDEVGKIAMFFGPLSQKGGERRLNVAVTRARRELIVYSTLRADQIDLAKTNARGVSDLKTFLSYAQHGPRVLPAANSLGETVDDFESPLEREICEALRARGHTVAAQVGCSGYRIDLAVVDPVRRGQYLLGIECDGANYHSAKTARDRDRLRQSVLEDLGWTLHRVWSSDWWEEREKQLDRVCTAIENAARNAKNPELPTAPSEIAVASAPSESVGAQIGDHSADRFASQVESPSLDAVPPTPSPSLASYRARRGRRLGTQEDFYDSSYSRQVRTELVAVVTAEGPIRLELAARRVAGQFTFERTKQKVMDRIEQLARDAGIKTTKHAERTFLWPSTMNPEEWTEFRVSQAEDPDARDAIDLPPREVANAVAHLLEVNGACPHRDLLRALARMFGFKALGGTVASSLEEGIALLISSKRARAGADGRVEPVE